MNYLSGLWQHYQAIIGVVFIVALFVAFALERFPPVVIAIVGAALMIVTGVLSPDEAVSVFANPAPITIAAFFVLSGALVRTGTIDAIAGLIVRRAKDHPRRTIAELMGGAAVAPAFVNNTPVVIILIPIVKRLAKTIGIPSTRLLIPLSYLAILSGTLTLIGTSTNLLVDGVSQEMGQAPFGIFETTGVGLVAMAAGIVTLLVLGPLVLPSRPDRDIADEGEQTFITELTLARDSADKVRTLGDLRGLQGGKVRLVGLKRGNVVNRKVDDSTILEPGDRLVVAASPHELDGLARAHDFVVGLQNVGQALQLASDERNDDIKLIGLTIIPTHPAIGRILHELPMLSRLPIRVLGLSRPRHTPGPDLANIRVRAGDTILIAARDKAIDDVRENVHFIREDTSAVRRFRRQRAPIALAALGLVILLAALDIMPVVALALVGVAVVLITRCVDVEDAWSAIDGNIIVLIFGMLAIGLGLQNMGSVRLVVDAVAPLLVGAPILIVVIVLYAMTSLLTETVTNNAVAVLMTPIAIGVAQEIGTDPRALLMTVMFAASASFATPIGYQTNTMVYAAADYRFSDFLKIGLPMNVIVGLATCAAILWLVPA